MLDVATAHRALLRHLEDREVLSLLACVDLGAHDLGDDVAGALDHHAVSLAHVEAMHLVEVVERRALHRRAAHEDRRERRDRREHAGAADIDEDVLDRRRRLFGGELERGRPARVVRNKAELLLILDAVDLHDDAVGAVIELLPFLSPLVHEREDRIDLLRRTPVRIGADAEIAQTLEQLRLRCDVETGGRIREEREVPFRRGRGVQLAHRTRGRVAGVRERRLAAFGALLVRRLK